MDGTGLRRCRGVDSFRTGRPLIDIKSAARIQVDPQIQAADGPHGKSLGGESRDREVDRDLVASFDSNQVADALGNVEGRIKRLAHRAASGDKHTASDAK